MQEIAAVSAALQPLTETLLVADAGLGNEAVRIAAAFNARVPLTGIILTRLDGAARAGAALSMSEQTHVPVKLVGTGERVDDLKVGRKACCCPCCKRVRVSRDTLCLPLAQVFNPKSTVDRILG